MLVRNAAIEPIVAVSSETQHDATDGIRRTATVVEKLRPALVAVLRHVLAEGAQQVGEQLRRQVVSTHRVTESAEDIVGHRVVLRRVFVVGTLGPARKQPGLPAVEQRQPLGRGPRTLVGEIVGAPGKGVDGGDVRSDGGREQPRRDREVLVVTPGEALATDVGTPQDGVVGHPPSSPWQKG